MSYPDSLPPPLSGPLKPITEPIQLPLAGKTGIAHAISGPSPSCINFTAVVTLTVEEYNRIQGEIERLQKVAEERAARIAQLTSNAPDFDELWERVMKSPGFCSLHASKAYRNLYLIPHSTGDALEYCVGPQLRKLIEWPEPQYSMVTNNKNIFTENGAASVLYSKLITALAAANSQPK